jgi:hypothetical protein
MAQDFRDSFLTALTETPGEECAWPTAVTDMRATMLVDKMVHQYLVHKGVNESELSKRSQSLLRRIQTHQKRLPVALNAAGEKLVDHKKSSLRLVPVRSQA